MSRFSKAYEMSKFGFNEKRKSIFSSVISVLKDSNTKKQMSIFINEAEIKVK
jgi:hypothetical protein